MFEFIPEFTSLIMLPGAHLNFIVGSLRAGQCVVRKVMSQQERVIDLCKLQVEPGMQPRHPDSPPYAQ